MTATALSTRALGVIAGLSYRSWFGLLIASALSYCYRISTVAQPNRDSPCVAFGRVFGLLYGLFQTDLAHFVLGYIAFTKEGEAQSEEASFNTDVTTTGPPEMRIQLVPILGSLFGGNYAFLIWDDDDPKRHAIAVDPADPHVVLAAARKERLDVQIVLTTHWHFDHSAGNKTMKRHLPHCEVVASAAERGRTPAVTKRLLDLEEMTCGRLTVRGHAVPGHTRGSMVFEIFSRAAPHAPSAAFTGDTLFCGGCGALFESSAATFHTSLSTLVHRLPTQTLLFPGHEYSEMLLTNTVRQQPHNEAARRKLTQVREKRKRRQPSLPSTLEEELTYNLYLQASPAQLASMCGAVEE